jgi:putative sigma-54 modulation protein
MQVHITGRHVEVTEAVRNHIYDKVERTLVDVPRIEDVRVVLDLQKREYFAEVLVQGKHIHVEGKSSSENLYTSIDEALEKAEHQLRKLRQKVQDHHDHPER